MMRWMVFGLVTLLAGCASGQVLAPGAPHDRNASLIISAAGRDMGIRLRYDYGNDDKTFAIPPSGVWVTSGEFDIEDSCFMISDYGAMYHHVHVAPGRHYAVGCRGEHHSELYFEDVGATPSEQVPRGESGSG